MSRPCIICGTRPHDRAYHEEFRRRRDRWVNLVDNRYPTLRGASELSEGSSVEKPRPRKGPCRTAHVVEPTPDFLRSVGRKGGDRRRMADLAGTLAWARLQGHLALDAPLRQVRGRPLIEGEGNP